MSTLLEICQTARQECGMGGTGPSTVTGLTGAMATLVNRTSQAWIDIQKSKPYWKFLRELFVFTMTEGQNEYVVADATTADPPGFGLTTVDKWDKQSCWIYETSLADRSQLVWMPYQNFRTQFGAYGTGRPTYFTEGPGGTVIFDKLPDAAYVLNMDYWMTPERLTANDDVPALPEQFHDIIAWKSVMKFAGNEGAAELFTYANSEFKPMFLQLCLDQLDVPTVNRAYPIAAGRSSQPRTFEDVR